MKTIGLIGGMSWESTIPYYSIINEYVREKLGGLHSAKIVLISVEFDEIEKCQSSGDWRKSADVLSDAAIKLEKIVSDFIFICKNTMHKVYAQIQESVSVPVIHIADATADKLKESGVKRVGLLGTRYTMTEDFYKSRVMERGFDVLIPNNKDIEFVNKVIFDQLCIGNIREESQREFSRIIFEMKENGAEAVILGCTEIGLLIKQENSILPVYDTTFIHAQRAASLAL